MDTIDLMAGIEKVTSPDAYVSPPAFRGRFFLPGKTCDGDGVNGFSDYKSLICITSYKVNGYSTGEASQVRGCEASFVVNTVTGKRITHIPPDSIAP